MNATGETIAPGTIVLNAWTPRLIIHADNIQYPPLQKGALQSEPLYRIPTPFPPPANLRPRSTTLLKRVSQRTQAPLPRSTRLLTIAPQRIQMLLSIMLFPGKTHIGIISTRPLFKAVPWCLTLQLGTVPKVHGVLKVVAPTLLTITVKSKAVKHRAVEHKATGRLLEAAPKCKRLDALLATGELGCHDASIGGANCLIFKQRHLSRVFVHGYIYFSTRYLPSL